MSLHQLTHPSFHGFWWTIIAFLLVILMMLILTGNVAAVP